MAVRLGQLSGGACRLILAKLRQATKRNLWNCFAVALLRRSTMHKQFSASAGAKLSTKDLDEFSGKSHPDDRTVFVGQLNPRSTGESVKEYFAKFGNVDEVTFKVPWKSNFSPYAFVVFKNVSTLPIVLSQTHTINLRKVNVQRFDKRPFRSRKIYVLGVPLQLTELQVRNHFSQFGKVEIIEFGFDPRVSRRTEYCFVEFTAEDAVLRALQFSKHFVDQYSLEVKKSIAHFPKNPVEGKVFVDNIPEGATVELVKDHFGKFGKLTFIDLVFYRDHKGQRDFAFVGFTDNKIVNQITGINCQHTIDGKQVIVKKATSYQGKEHRDLEIFVEKIPSTTNEEHVKKYFEAYGVVRNVRMIRRWRCTENLQSGIIRFSKMADVNHVMKKAKHVIDGREVTLRKTGWTAPKPKPLLDEQSLSFL